MSKFTKLFSFIVVVILICGIGACADDEDCCIIPPLPLGAQIWIANEGGFSQGNASLDVYDTENNVYTSSLFETTNGRGLGDIFQSVTFYGNKAYLIINNSQRIEVINVDDYSSISTITEHIYSPRYAVVIQDKLYVSDLTRPYIYIIDTGSDLVIDSIPTGVPVEDMIAHGENIFASANNFFTPLDQVLVISTTQKQITDNVKVGLNPNAMIKDAADMIWVMCDGEYAVSGTEGLYRINAATKTVDKSFAYTSFTPQYPGRLAVNSDNAQDIYINGPLGIYKIAIDDISLPLTPHVLYSGSTYGIGINPQNEDIYIGDAGDFSAQGTISVYQQSGELKETLSAGHLPSRFYFK